MENISLTSWDQAFFGSSADHDELGGFGVVNLHEMAHSYFGDLVVIRDFSCVAQRRLGIWSGLVRRDAQRRRRAMVYA